MGSLITDACCIDSKDIFENTNFKNTMSGKDDMNYNETNFCSSEIKNLPDSEINPKKPEKTKIGSLSRIPISTKNVILQKDGTPFDYYFLPVI